MMLLGQPLLAQTTIDDYNVHHRGSVIGDDVLYNCQFWTFKAV